MDVDMHLDSISAVPPRTTLSAATEADYAICWQIMRRASRNYTFASRYLPADKLPYVAALYAFMRVGDDRVDVSHSGFQSALEAIDDWERTYWEAFELGHSPHPVMRAYLDMSARFNIPPETMSSYFRAMRADLTTTRYPTFADLLTYMDGSAIPVGRAMTYILGVRAPYSIADAFPGADSLAIAMQLTNFWRDIGSDWRIGRVYLPLEDMQRYGYDETLLSQERITPNFIDLMEFEFERTEAYYTTARQSVKMLACGNWAVMSALEIYSSILASIRRNRYDVFSRRAGSRSIRKLGLVFKSYWRLKHL